MKKLIISAWLILSVLGFTVATAAANDIQARMKQRLPTINSLKAKGIVGENNRGLLQYRTAEQPHKAVIEAENADRMEIYTRVAGQQKVTVAHVGSRRALQIASIAKPGTWLQDKEGKWYRKPK